MHKHIIVEDRRPGKPRTGDIITEAERTKLLGSEQRVYTMPCDPEIVASGAITGFALISYGRGHDMAEAIPGRACRLALYVLARPGTLHWRARITIDEKMREEAAGTYTGVMRLVSDTSQGFSGGTVGANPDTAFNFNTLSDDTNDGEGWVIGGTARSTPQIDSVYGYALHGVGRGFRVLWAAISQVG